MRSPGRLPERSLTVTGRPLPSLRRLGDRHGLVGVVEQGRAGAGLADLPDGAAHVEVDHVGAGLGRYGRRDPHDLGVVAEQLDRDRVLVGVDAQELAVGALVAVLEPEARHHLRDREAGAVALACRRTNQLPMPASGASTRRLGRR